MKCEILFLLTLNICSFHEWGPHFVVSPHQIDSCPAYENISDTAAQTEDPEEQEDLVWSPVRLEPPASNKTGPLQIYSHSSIHNFTPVSCDFLQMQLNQRRDSPDGNKVVRHWNIPEESEAVEDAWEVDTFTFNSRRFYCQFWVAAAGRSQQQHVAQRLEECGVGSLNWIMSRCQTWFIVQISWCSGAVWLTDVYYIINILLIYFIKIMINIIFYC